jgi:hypothetical protein
MSLSLEENLLAIETELWTGGPEAYRKHTDDKCVVVFEETAATMSREDIAKTAEKGRWKDIKMTEKGLARLSDEAVVISYDCTATRKDGQPHHALVSSGYARRNGSWKLAFHQQTKI